MQAIVLAGGQGTRLRPLTYTRPKPLVAVANRPALDHIVAAAARAGFTEVIFTTNYMAEAVRSHCAVASYPIPVRCLEEVRPLGTAGAVKNAEAAITGPFAVIQGDALAEIDLAALAAAHGAFGGMVTIAAMAVENPSEFGILELDGNSRIRRFLEKPKPEQCFSNLANTGFYILEPEVLAEIPAGTAYDFSFELFPKLMESGRAMYGWRTEAYWIDLGRIGSYLAGNARCLARLGRVEIDPQASVDPQAELQPPVLVGPGTRIEAGSRIGPDVVIGRDAHLGPGVQVKGAVVYDRVRLETEAMLEACVVAEETLIGARAMVGRSAVIGTGCRVGAGARILDGSRVGPFVIVEEHSVVEGVVEPSPERLEQRLAAQGGHRAFAGLTAEETAICAALAELGEASAKTLAGAVRLPFSRIHGVLFGLGKRELVVARGEAPKLFSLLYEDPERIARRLARPA